MGPATHQDQPGRTLPPSYRYKPFLLLILCCCKPVSIFRAAAASFQIAATNPEQLVNICQQSPWAWLPASRNLQPVHELLPLLPVQLLQAFLVAVAEPFKAASGVSPSVITPLHDTELTACRVVAGQ